MTLLLLAAALPALFWDAAPDTAQALRDAGIRRITAPAARMNEWKGVEGIAAGAGDTAQTVKLQAPKVNYLIDQATATRAPWIVSNGYRILRRPRARFYYEAPGAQAAVAAAEAYAWNADALIKTDAAGLKPLAQMLEFLGSLDTATMAPVVDFGFIDDGSATAGEVMNLLVRRNLLFRVLKAPDPNLRLNIKLGDRKHPLEQAKNPGMMAQIIRTEVTDKVRSLRIYGTEVVVGRVLSASRRLRVELINYDGAERTVDGLRVRVQGQYASYKAAVAGNPDGTLLDYAVLPGATEFTLAELGTYAVIDLFN